MAIVDIDVNQIRFNQVTRQFEYALGTAWVPVGLLGENGGIVDGPLQFSITGSLTPPILTTAERNALTATEGMVIYNITQHKLNVFTDTGWQRVQFI